MSAADCLFPKKSDSQSPSSWTPPRHDAGGFCFEAISSPLSAISEFNDMHFLGEPGV